MSCYSSFPSSSSSGNDQSEDLVFEISDYLSFNEDLLEGFASALTPPPVHEQQQQQQQHLVLEEEYADNVRSSGSDGKKRGCKRKEIATEAGLKVAFRTKSEKEIMDDGYKWRKYGKKKVKNSPNPRNYYSCSAEGCNVKKRVERDRDDSNYVITTYEGVHNHHAPSLVASHHILLEPNYTYDFSSHETLLENT